MVFIRVSALPALFFFVLSGLGSGCERVTATSIDCAAGMVAENGVCVAVCENDADCEDSQTCVSETCQDCTGGACEGQEVFCEVSDCGKNGTCDQTQEQCLCDANFEGALCDTCVGDYRGVECDECPSGEQDNDGDFQCEPQCEAASCGANGSCDDASGNVVCTCDTGYAGALCDTCDAGYQDNDNDGVCALDCAAANPCSGMMNLSKPIWNDGSRTHVGDGMVGYPSDHARLSCYDHTGTAVCDDGNLFGYALGVGDFNDDDFDDLAVGAPTDSRGASGAGAVYIFHGSANGLGEIQAIWTQESEGVSGVSEESDFFGFALSVGDYNADGFSDLAIGVPGETFGSVDSGGMVQVLYGSAAGLVGSANLDEDTTQVWHQNVDRDSVKIAQAYEDGDRFGMALATVKANNGNGSGQDLTDDLLIGAPGETMNGDSDVGAGYAHLIFGEAGVGLVTANNQGFSSEAGNLVAGGHFGFSVSASEGEIVGTTLHRMWVGAPGEGLNRRGSIQRVGWSSSTDTLSFEERNPGGLNNDEYGYAMAGGKSGPFDDAPGIVAGMPGRTSSGGQVRLWYRNNDTTQLNLTQHSGGSCGDGREDDDRFGAAVLAGADFTGSADDLEDFVVAGIPGESRDPVTAGRGALSIFAFDSDADALETEGLCLFEEDFRPPGSITQDLRMGYSLAQGDFNNDGFDDLVSGIPSDPGPTRLYEGSARIIYGSATGLDTAGSHLISPVGRVNSDGTL